MYVDSYSGTFVEFDKAQFERVMEFVGHRTTDSFTPVFGKDQPIHVAVSATGAQVINKVVQFLEWIEKSKGESVSWYQFTPQNWDFALEAFDFMQSPIYRYSFRQHSIFEEVQSLEHQGLGKNKLLDCGRKDYSRTSNVDELFCIRAQYVTYLSRNKAELFKILALEVSDSRRGNFVPEVFVVNEGVYKFIQEIKNPSPKEEPAPVQPARQSRSRRRTTAAT